jgi:hypothetical protein
MAQSLEVSQAQREATYADACQRLQAAGEWLDARAGGHIPPGIEAEMDEALTVVRREGRKLTKTIRRLAKK